ncbi:MAG: elongation factor G [Ruminococcaceae bacterium]|nr:elongation factor G [Oscillospiraceae bacterium]
MKDYPVAKLRNVVLLGHGRAGKTSLTEALLYSTGASERLGSIAAGNTVSDYDAEEIKRLCSISTSVLPVEWAGGKINFIDTPGYFDFVGEQVEAVAAADCAVLVVSGKSGVSVGAEKAWDLCEKKGIPLMIFINKLDDEKADYYKVLNELKEKFGKCIAPFLVPIKNGESIDGFVNVVNMTARHWESGKAIDGSVPAGLEDEIQPVRDMIIEAVAETDDDLLNKFFEGEEFTAEEIFKGLKYGTRRRDIVPVLCGSAINKQGIMLLLDAIMEYMPAPDAFSKVAETAANEPVEVDADINGPLAAQCFKTIADPFIGRLSFVRVYRGVLKKDSTIYNVSKKAEEKIGRIYFMRGKKQIETDSLQAGDIGAVPKLTVTSTGDSLCDKATSVLFETITFPAPVTSMAIMPKAKGDEEKISAGLHKMMEEDKTIRLENNAETHQQVVSGIGEQHIEVIVSKLKTKYGVDVDLAEPKVPYRETIRKTVKAEGKHKKQSGGHGQYGHVWIEFAPTDSEELVFEEKVFGGAVPKNFFPAVEKGLKDSMAHGVLAGYPVVGLKATLYDGSYHSVDSSEMAFKMAANLAYKAGLAQASPVLLEPIGTLTVTIPNANMGDVMGDINKRRGRVLGSEPQSGGNVTITADVPMAEMAKFATDLRSMTQGRGSFSLEFHGYEQAPDHVAKKIIEQSAKET